VLLKTARKAVVGVIGGTVLLVGVVMLVTPGPGLVVIPAGLAILATEFVIAARVLKKIGHHARALAEKAGFVSRDGSRP
jgi:uncharacterized protein (TIGR02611 family)